MQSRCGDPSSIFSFRAARKFDTSPPLSLSQLRCMGGVPCGLMDATVPFSHTNSLSSLPCHIVMKPAAFSCLYCLVCGLVYSPLALLMHALHCCFLPLSEAGIYFSKTDSGYLLNVCQDFASQLYQSCSAITRESPAVPRTSMYPSVPFEGQLFHRCFCCYCGLCFTIPILVPRCI